MISILLGLTLFSCSPAFAITYDRVQSMQILTDATATGSGDVIQPWKANRVFQATGLVSASTGAATILIEGSLDNSLWETLDTLSLTLGTTATSDFGVVDAPWRYVRARVTAISGTGATVQVYMGSGGK